MAAVDRSELPGEEVPVEVFNFFRIEAAAVLDRVERLCAELDGAGASAATGPRRDLQAALARVSDLATTFGFAAAGELAALALDQVREGRLDGLEEHVAALRGAVAAPTPSPITPAATTTSPAPSDPPPPARPAAESPPPTVVSSAGDVVEALPDSEALLDGETPADSAVVAEIEALAAAEESVEIEALRDEKVQPHDGAGSEAPAAAPTEASPATDEDVVPIETLCYSGEAALRRALELESAVREAADGDAARAAAHEVFDLIRLALPQEGRGSAV